MRTFYFVCDFLYTIARIWGTLLLVGVISEPKWGRRVHYAVWTAVMIAVAGLNVCNHIMIGMLFSNTCMIVIILLLSLASGATYGCRCRDAFCVTFLLWTGLALVDFFVQTMIYGILEALGTETDIFLTATLYRGIYLLLCTMLLCVTLHYACRWMKRTGCETGVYLKWGWLLVLPFFMGMVYFQRIYKSLVSEQVMWRWWLFLMGNMLMALFFGVYLFAQKEKERSRLLKLRMDMMGYDYRELLKVYEEKEILLHDVRKHMLVIREMTEAGQKQEIFRYLDELNGILQKGRNRDLVNHDLLNLILNQKFQEAEDVKISLQYDMGDMSGLTLKPTEICALFSNILDNAIEANQKLAEGMERWIKLTCTRKGQILAVFISNPVAGKKIRFAGGIPETTKKDKVVHGFGMRSIRQVVNMHDGHMLIETKDGIFNLTVCLKVF